MLIDIKLRVCPPAGRVFVVVENGRLIFKADIIAKPPRSSSLKTFMSRSNDAAREWILNIYHDSAVSF